jgi:hypothetical protein
MPAIDRKEMCRLSGRHWNDILLCAASLSTRSDPSPDGQISGGG